MTALAAAVAFTCIGLILIPYAGIQNDEALFSGLLFRPSSERYSIAAFGHHFPLMVFPYTGALKTILYWPTFHVFRPGPYSLRFPMVLAGAITIVVFYLFTESISCRRAALLAAVLLATDGYSL